jgi:hypothetical protein
MASRFKLFRFLQRQPAPPVMADDVSMPTEAQAAPDVAEAENIPAVSPLVFQVTAHLAGIGDRKAAEDGWAGSATGTNRIEGFIVSCDAPGWPEQVTFQAVQNDRTLGDAVAGGQYCGTRGKSLPLRGFVMHVPAEEAEFEGIFYQGVFQDGFRSALLRPGNLCVSPDHAVLLAMRITTDPDAAAAP